MRFLINILIPLFYLAGNYCHLQKGKGELVPLVKHSYKIDSLLLSFVNNNDNSFAVKYPCFSVNIEKDNKIVALHIQSVSKARMNEILGGARLKNYYIGCFDLNNYKVFVYSTKKFEGLFLETNQKRRINFIDFSPKSSLTDSSSVLDIPYLADFVFENGKFEPMYGAR